MKKLLPILLALMGVGAGVGAGIVMKPGEEHATLADCGPLTSENTHNLAAAALLEEVDLLAQREYVKMSNQFVVPIVGEDRISSLVVVSLSVEVKPGATEAVYSREPRLRDGFLQVLFDHANLGGFKGSFTQSDKLDTLRRALMQVAKDHIGPSVTDVLITEIARQDA
ncbi:flagellar basal body-associated FliL family protein [Puniceibacterium sp. IMCC21224]|uniref:flagellar basal body-associated FliL family protein n=1 Tax=Puniceibacterium sp. IMCC21224 TaxID=1618204 RepID=UPI00064DE3AF|nr:flagellar basal body-associated FliL family protein [Puniceibacterium sp. IMCC21224]KMK65551.1 Flagellar basal body-associated protein FliL [Puniceibacterium sp. IMCC21224]